MINNEKRFNIILITMPIWLLPFVFWWLLPWMAIIFIMNANPGWVAWWPLWGPVTAGVWFFWCLAHWIIPLLLAGLPFRDATATVELFMQESHG